MIRCPADYSRAPTTSDGNVLYPNAKYSVSEAEWSGFLKAAVAYYESLGITVERVMTDNGSCYRSKAFARACRKLGLGHSHKTLHAEGQRQGRALHTDRAEGMGLCRRIPDVSAARRAARLDSSIQSAQATRQPSSS